MLLEQAGRVGQRILAELVFLRLNLLVAEAAATQFEFGPLQFAAALAAEQLRRKVPSRGGGQQGR